MLENDGVHPLLSAVGHAFGGHRPLILSPDAVWLTIMQGLAQHVRLHAEELRPRLVAHSGKKRLAVRVLRLPEDSAEWRDVVEKFGKLLLAEINDAVEFDCDFSTSTDVERVAGRIVLLDVYSPYFAVWLHVVCGIPAITLTGTVEDWRKIRSRVDTIASFGLETWCRSLAAICDQFVRAAAGDVDIAFWRRVYNPIDAYGGKVITGWAARFYPYLKGDGEVTRPNPLLDLPIGEPRDVAPDPNGHYDGPGIRSSGVPAVVSRVRVNVNDRVNHLNRVVALNAGLVGVAQDEDGALRPMGGWYLAPATVEIDDVIDRIVRDHQTDPPVPLGWGFQASAELAALFRRIGSGTMFDGAWRLLPAADHGMIWRRVTPGLIRSIIDLADGRSLCAAIDFETSTSHWIVCRIERADDEPMQRNACRLLDDPADIPVYGTSLALLLDAALDSGGDISHLETCRLDQLDGTST
ncbi:DUF4419 domain-containing protein [Actinomadura sp. 3N508]|uniref:DUF4419 domain-containing protein n=1 Tax=Actinomadura sp. 3N508 TaxID=3375153 RepID=UPI00379F98BE